MKIFTLNYIYIVFALVFLFITSINQNFAQQLPFNYSFSGNSCATESSGASSTNGLTFASFTRGATSCDFISNIFNSSNWQVGGNSTSSHSNNRYIQFSVTNTGGSAFTFKTLNITMVRNSSGPSIAQLEYCTGSCSSQTTIGSTATVTTTPTAFTFTSGSTISIGASQTMFFRIYGWGAGNAAGTLAVYGGNLFRSKASGNWSSTSSWETSISGTTWANATTTPTSNSGSITIQSGHTITVSSAVTADEININSGGNLTINSGITLTVSNGNGADLANTGTLDIQGTVAGSSGPSIVFASGATLATNNTNGVDGALTNFTSKTFSGSNDNNFTFNASGNQNTGTLMPTTLNGITISGSGTKTLSQKTSLLPTGVVTVSAGTFNLNNDSLILKSNASSTARVAPVSGSFSNASKFTIQRFIPSGSGRFWWHLSSPVANTFVSDWQNEFYITGSFPNTSTVPHADSSTASLKYYDESVSGDLNNGWIDYPKNINSNSAPLVVGRGYIAFIRTGFLSSKNKTINVTGTPNVGTINYNVQYHSSGNINNDGWNLIGNPYPSDIDWANSGWSRTNIDNAVYVWNAASSTYSSFVGGVGVNGGTGRIPSSHAFWVKANGSNPSLTSSESVKTATQNVFTKQEAISNLLRIKLKDTIASDEIAIRFDEEATNNFDNSFDAYGMTGPHLGLSTTSADSVALAINTRPEITDGLAIQLNTYFSANGTYKMVFNNQESFDGEFQIFLRDKFLNKSLDVNKDSIYNFSVTAEPNSNAKNRFEIVFKKAQATAIFTPKNNLNFNLYPNPSDGNNLTFTFAENSGSEYHITILDMLGKEMISESLINDSGSKNIRLDSKLPSGIYIVNCVSNDKSSSRTLIIK